MKLVLWFKGINWFLYGLNVDVVEKGSQNHFGTHSDKRITWALMIAERIFVEFEQKKPSQKQLSV